MIHLTLLNKEILENRVKLYLSFALLALLAVALPFLFEPTRDFFKNVDLSYYLDQQQLNFIGASYNNYAWSQWTGKNLTQMGVLAAIVFGMGALSGESSFGTALFLLSKPITRREIYTTKMAAGLLLLACTVIGSTLLLMLVSLWKGYPLDGGAFLTANLIAYAGLSVIYLGTALFSALIAEPVKAGVAAALFWLLVSVPGYFPGSAQYSIFYQIKAIPYWFFGQNPIVPLGFFLVLAGAFYETGVWLWSRREF
ncbi:MAG: ABC transporter permease subunit [Bacillota bacterium]